MKLFGLVVLILLFLASIFGKDQTVGFSKFRSLGLKGVLSVLIVIHHFTLCSPLSIPMKGSWYSMGAVCVSLFFFLSGYGLHISMRKMSQTLSYWTVRFLKLFIPFLTISILCMLLDIIGIVNVPHYSMFEGRPYLPHSWFVLDLAICYIIYAIFHTISSKLISYVVLFGLLILNVYAAYLLDYPENWTGTTISFGIGIVFSSCQISLNKKTWCVMASVLLLLLTSAVVSPEWADSPRSLWGIMFISVIPMCLVPVLSSYPCCVPVFVKKQLGYLGAISYELYLIHGLVLYSKWMGFVTYWGLLWLLFASVISAFVINVLNNRIVNYSIARFS